jgi:hypothetical protein
MILPHSDQEIGQRDKKIKRETWILNDSGDQMDLKDIYTNITINSHRIWIPLYSWWKFLMIEYISGHKATIIKYKKTEITFCIFSDHNVETNVWYKESKKQSVGSC